MEPWRLGLVVLASDPLPTLAGLASTLRFTALRGCCAASTGAVRGGAAVTAADGSRQISWVAGCDAKYAASTSRFGALVVGLLRDVIVSRFVCISCSSSMRAACHHRSSAHQDTSWLAAPAAIASNTLFIFAQSSCAVSLTDRFAICVQQESRLKAGATPFWLCLLALISPTHTITWAN